MTSATQPARAVATLGRMTQPPGSSRLLARRNAPVNDVLRTLIPLVKRSVWDLPHQLHVLAWDGARVSVCASQEFPLETMTRPERMERLVFRLMKLVVGRQLEAAERGVPVSAYAFVHVAEEYRVTRPEDFDQLSPDEQEWHARKCAQDMARRVIQTRPDAYEVRSLMGCDVDGRMFALEQHRANPDAVILPRSLGLVGDGLTFARPLMAAALLMAKEFYGDPLPVPGAPQKGLAPVIELFGRRAGESVG